MIYEEFGKTGIKLSALGFGAMRLPMKEADGKKIVDASKCVSCDACEKKCPQKLPIIKQLAQTYETLAP